MVKIVIDTVGGFFAPKEVVIGAAEASRLIDAKLLLLGDQTIIRSILDSAPHNPKKISIHHLEQDDLNRIPSIGLSILNKGEGDAMVTAGRILPMLEENREKLPLLKGVTNPALATVYPTRLRRGQTNDPFSLILDHGALLRATAADLVNFAVMGSAYARCISRNEIPRIALLSVSRDQTIGPPEVREACDILEKLPNVDFIGTIEGTEIPKGIADVIVCDGFTGHIVVRMLDGLTETVLEAAESAYEEKLMWRIGLKMLSGQLKRLRRLIDWSEYGGAPLLGLDKPILVAHEESRAKSIVSTLKVALKSVKDQIPKKIEEQLSILESL